MLAVNKENDLLTHGPHKGKMNAKTPGPPKLHPKTPFKIPLNDENVEAKTAKKGLFGGKDPSLFVTPVGMLMPGSALQFSPQINRTTRKAPEEVPEDPLSQGKPPMRRPGSPLHMGKSPETRSQLQALLARASLRYLSLWVYTMDKRTIPRLSICHLAHQVRALIRAGTFLSRN